MVSSLGGQGWGWSLELDAAVGKCIVGGAGLAGLGELDIVIIVASGAGGGDACLFRASPMVSPLSGSAALAPLVPCSGLGAPRVPWPKSVAPAGGSILSITTSRAGDAARVRVGERVWRARRAGDCEPRDKDLAVGVGLVGDHPSDGVAGTHS